MQRRSFFLLMSGIYFPYKERHIITLDLKNQYLWQGKMACSLYCIWVHFMAFPCLSESIIVIKGNTHKYIRINYFHNINIDL